MGIRLIDEVLDDAPRSLTARELNVLLVLARGARDETRLCWPGVEDDPVTIHRMRLPARSSRYEVLQALKRKGALEVVTAGHRGSRAVYRIPVFASLRDTPKGPENPDPTRSKGPGSPDPIEPKGSGNHGPYGQKGSGFQGPNENAKGPENPDPTRSKGPGSPDPTARKGPENPDPYLSLPQEIDISLTPRASPAPDDAFAAFWSAYPRKVGKGAAKKAHAAAIKAGADPAHLADAAGKHRAHWQAIGRTADFIPYPATWLRAESYDDELHTPQPAGPPVQPYKPPLF